MLTKSFDKTKTDFQKIREDFPILFTEMNGKPLVYLDSAASSQKPTEVVEAISQYYYQTHANVHRGVYQLSQRSTEAFETARKKVRDFINARHDHEIIFTKGTTEGVNLLSSTFSRAFLKAGDEVLITEMEHHSNIVPWQIACEQSGAKLKVAPVNERGELILEAFENLLSERTRMVALAHISNALGTVNPVESIIKMAHEKVIPVMLDCAQSAPHTLLDVQKTDADFIVFSAHKMFGPTGIGVLYGKENWLEKLPPYQSGGEMIEEVSFEKTTFNGLPFKFEAGTPDIAGAVGLAAAIDYLQKFDRSELEEYETALMAYATAGLEKIPGLQIIGKAAEKVGVISFNLEKTHPYDVGTILDKLGIAVRTGHHCTQPLMKKFGIPGTVRASFAFYNNFEDADRLVKGVERAVKMLKA